MGPARGRARGRATEGGVTRPQIDPRWPASWRRHALALLEREAPCGCTDRARWRAGDRRLSGEEIADAADVRCRWCRGRGVEAAS